MKSCQELIFKKGGLLAECGKPAKYTYLGKCVCSSHSPEQKELAKERKKKRGMEKIGLQFAMLKNIVNPQILDECE